MLGSFLDLSMTGGMVSSRVCEGQGGFRFEGVSFPFLDRVLLAPLLVVYMFSSLFILQKYALMLMTSKVDTNSCLLNQGC